MKYIILLMLVTLFSCQEKQEVRPVVKTKVVVRKEVKQKIYLFGLGDVPLKNIDFVKKELVSFYNYDVVVLPNQEIPKTLMVQGINKYQANNILDYLDSTHKKYDGKVLAITNVNICTDRELNGIIYKNWSIFGLGKLGGKSCVVSTNRMGKKYKDRLAKVTIHEIGHTLGLHHCENDEHCLMNDAKGKGKKVDDEKKWMCDKCRNKIKLK